jgi:hypothetical protein
VITYDLINNVGQRKTAGAKGIQGIRAQHAVLHPNPLPNHDLRNVSFLCQLRYGSRIGGRAQGDQNSANIRLTNAKPRIQPIQIAQRFAMVY